MPSRLKATKNVPAAADTFFIYNFASGTTTKNELDFDEDHFGDLINSSSLPSLSGFTGSLMTLRYEFSESLTMRYWEDSFPATKQFRVVWQFSCIDFESI